MLDQFKHHIYVQFYHTQHRIDPVGSTPKLFQWSEQAGAFCAVILNPVRCDSPELVRELLLATVHRCPSLQEPDPAEGYRSRGVSRVPIQSRTWGKVKPSVS